MTVMSRRTRTQRSQRPARSYAHTAQQLLAEHRRFADLCIDNAYSLVPNAPPQKLGDMPRGVALAVAGGPAPIQLIPVQLGPPPIHPDTTRHSLDAYKQADAAATLELVRMTARDIGVHQLALIWPDDISEDIYTLKGGPLAGQTVAAYRASCFMSVITPVAHETWMATTVWIPETRTANTDLSPMPEDPWYSQEALLSFAAALAS